MVLGIAHHDLHFVAPALHLDTLVTVKRIAQLGGQVKPVDPRGEGLAAGRDADLGLSGQGVVFEVRNALELRQALLDSVDGPAGVLAVGIAPRIRQDVDLEALGGGPAAKRVESQAQCVVDGAGVLAPRVDQVRAAEVLPSILGDDEFDQHVGHVPPLLPVGVDLHAQQRVGPLHHRLAGVRLDLIVEIEDALGDLPGDLPGPFDGRSGGQDDGGLEGVGLHLGEDRQLDVPALERADHRDENRAEDRHRDVPVPGRQAVQVQELIVDEALDAGVDSPPHRHGPPANSLYPPTGNQQVDQRPQRRAEQRDEPQDRPIRLGVAVLGFEAVGEVAGQDEDALEQAEREGQDHHRGHLADELAHDPRNEEHRDKRQPRGGHRADDRHDDLLCPLGGRQCGQR